MKHLFFDCEIVRPVPPSNPDDRILKIDYCQGWHDFEGMGISVIGWSTDFKVVDKNNKVLVGSGQHFTLIDNVLWKYQSGTEHLLRLKQAAREADLIIGFNSRAFDDKLVLAHGLDWLCCDADLLRAIRVASGQPPTYKKGVTRAGYTLDNLAIANGLKPNSGSSSQIPIDWQQKRYDKVVDHCLYDVQLLETLYNKFLAGKLIDPTNGEILRPRTKQLMSLG